MLVEAKAHRRELAAEACGKRMTRHSSADNDVRIAQAIAEANDAFCRATGEAWQLSSKRCYQMSNRFAWAWKLCTLGYPVALVYLGFIEAEDMEPDVWFRDAAEWRDLVIAESVCLFPAHTWDSVIDIEGTALLPLIRSSEQRLAA